MKKNPALWVALGLSVLLNLFYIVRQEVFPESNDISSNVVVRVVDGDTFDVSNERRIRLAGIDAPEYRGGCLSVRAKERLEELVLGKTVDIEVYTKGVYGRDVSWVVYDGVLINKVMVDEGLASYEKTDDPKDVLLYRAQVEAEKTRRGIWSSECTHERAGCEIKGNVYKDTTSKIYHLPECKHYNQVVILSNEGDRWFCSESEAEKAGFKKSEGCP